MLGNIKRWHIHSVIVDPHYLKIDVSGYAQKLINLQYSNSDTIFITPTTILKEVVVEAMNANDLGNKISYRIAMADMNRYNNFLQALNEIPNLTVLSSGEAFYEGSDNVRFLLDGVETTKTEPPNNLKGRHIENRGV